MKPSKTFPSYFEQLISFLSPLSPILQNYFETQVMYLVVKMYVKMRSSICSNALQPATYHTCLYEF